MTPCGESRNITEATGLSKLISTKHINVGTWNVRIMYQTYNTAQVAAEMTTTRLHCWGSVSQDGHRQDKKEY